MPEDTESAQDIMKTIRDKLAELEDLQLVNKLDIINMKNEVDKLSLTSASGPETAEKLSQLKELAEKADTFKKVAKADMDAVRAKRAELESARMPAAPAGKGAPPKEVEETRKKMDELEKRISGMPAAKPGEAGGKEIEKLWQKMGELEKKGPSTAPTAPSGVPEDISREINAINKKLSELERAKPQGGKAPAPAAELPRTISSER